MHATKKTVISISKESASGRGQRETELGSEVKFRDRGEGIERGGKRGVLPESMKKRTF